MSLIDCAVHERYLITMNYIVQVYEVAQRVSSTLFYDLVAASLAVVSLSGI